MEIIKKTAVAAWLEALNILSRDGAIIADMNQRSNREVLGLRIELTDPAHDIDAPIRILLSFKKWIYPSLDEIANVILSKRLSPAYVYSYGNSLFNYETTNQIDDFVIPLLRRDPSSRRAVATLWNPRQAALSQDGIIPGLVFLDFKLRDERLYLTAFIRSSDLFFGWPSNLYQLFILQQYVAEKIGCHIGSLITYSTSAHIFEEHLPDIKAVLEKEMSALFV